MTKVCGLGRFAEDAGKAGYKNPNGTINLLDALAIVKKYGKLVPKSELTDVDLKELKDAAIKMRQNYALSNDRYVKV